MLLGFIIFFGGIFGYIVPTVMIGVHYGFWSSVLAIVYILFLTKCVKGPLKDAGIIPFVYFGIMASFAIMHWWALIVVGAWLFLLVFAILSVIEDKGKKI